MFSATGQLPLFRVPVTCSLTMCANLIRPIGKAGMAELADAADSKSAEVYPSWGFNSPSRHQSTPLYFQTLGIGSLSCLLITLPPKQSK